jgi:ubiquinone/menaquinone biosynthesis C-methylase UbiE
MSESDEMGLTPEAAQGYEDFFLPAIFSQWPPQILHAAQVKPGDNLLEVGCGTGVLARQATTIVLPDGSVTGLDLSESMLSVARRKCPGAVFQQGNVMDLPFENESFDVVIASFVLMFVPDQPRAIREMWRVLKPGGRLVIAVWESLEQNPAYARLVGIAEQKIDQAAGESMAWPFALGEPGKLAEVFDAAEVAAQTIDAYEGRANFASIEQFVRTEIESWVLSESVNDVSLDSVLSDAHEQLAEFCDAGGALDIPFNALIAVAEKHR